MSCQGPCFDEAKFGEIHENRGQTYADQSPSQLLSDFIRWLQSTQTNENAQITAVHNFVENANEVIYGFIEWPESYYQQLEDNRDDQEGDNL